MFYVYILECRDGTLYTGWTTDLIKRLAKHNGGKGAKYTRVRRPVVLRYSRECATKSEAMKWEFYLKQLSREEKITFIAGRGIKGKGPFC